MSRDERSYSSGMAFALASFGSIAVSTLVTSILSARIYGITVVGEAALVLAPVAIVTLLSTVREQPAMVREIAKLPPRDPRVTGVALAVFAFSTTLTALVTALGVGACLLLFRGPLEQPELFAPAAAGLLGYLAIINTCWNIDGVLGAFRAGRELFAVRLHQALMYGALLVAFSFVSDGVWSLTLAFLGSWLTSLVHRLALMPRVLRLRVPRAEIRAGFSALREIVTFGLKITPGSIASGLSISSGTWILGLTSSINAVGAYSRAANVSGRLGELNWRVTEMLLPTLVQRRAAGDSEGYDRVVVDSLRYVAFGMLLPAAVGGGAAGGIMEVFGAGFATAAAALCWLLFVPLLQTIVAIQGCVLMASNQPLWMTYAQVTRLVVTLTGGILLTQAFGLTGMAVATAGGCLAGLVVCMLVMRVRSPLPRPSSWWMARQLAGLGAAYASGFAVARALEREVAGAPGLLLALAAGTLAYVVVGLAVGGTEPRDRTRLRGLLTPAGARRADTAASSAVPRSSCSEDEREMAR